MICIDDTMATQERIGDQRHPPRTEEDLLDKHRRLGDVPDDAFAAAEIDEECA